MDVFLLFGGHELLADEDTTVLFYALGIFYLLVEFALSSDEEVLGAVLVIVGWLGKSALPWCRRNMLIC